MTVKVLLKDIVIPAGTIFKEAPKQTKRFGSDHLEVVVGLSKNTTGSFSYCTDDDPKVMGKFFADLREGVDLIE